jgi:nitrogen PTS system EIIA component
VDFVDYLSEDKVVLLWGRSTAAALAELITLLSHHMDSTVAGDLTKAVWEREGLMSTGIGQGLAFPHVRLQVLQDAAIAVGVSRAGIDDYESLNGEPVHIVLLIAAPQGKHELYIRLLARVANVLTGQTIRAAVIAADASCDVFAILEGSGA